MWVGLVTAWGLCLLSSCNWGGLGTGYCLFGVYCWVYLCVTLTVAHGPWLWLVDNHVVVVLGV